MLYAAVAILPWLVSGYIIFFLQGYESLMENWTPLVYVAYFTLVTITMGLAITHTTFIAILSGYFFSWYGMPGIIISYLLASVIGLALGKLLCRTVAGGYLSDLPKFKQFFERLKSNSFQLVIYGRLSPVLPFALMNTAFASVDISWRNYIWGSLFGMLPRTLVFFYAGMKAGEIWQFIEKPTIDGFYSILPVVLLVVSSLGLIRLFVKSKNG